MTDIEWAKGVLAIEFLGKDCQGTWVPTLSKRNKKRAVKILVEAGMDEYCGITLTLL